MRPWPAHIFGILAVVLFLIAPGHAQEPGAASPTLEVNQAQGAKQEAEDKQRSAGATYIPEPQERYSVLVLGDTLAGGLWAGMGRAVTPEDRFQIEGRYREGSGFARADLYDWLDALPGILDRNQVHAAVVLLGSNDGQDMRSGNERLAFGSPEWKSKYQEIVDQFLTELRKRNIAVYWVELPPMARSDYDEAMQQINALLKERTEAVGVKFIEIRNAFTDETGKYTEMGMDAETGTYRRLRDRDGIHFLKRGNTKLGSMVLDVLRADVKAAENPPPAAEADAGKSEGTTPAAVVNLPFFGQPGPKGPIMIQPQAPQTARRAPAGTVGAEAIAEVIDLDAPGGKDGLGELQQSAAPGSVAEKLFAQGIPPAPMPGRMDDFSWPGN